jgi:predicted GNAT family N-acyltransferase
MNKNLYTLEPTDWRTHHEELYQIRRIVFVEEQSVPEELEQDEHDEACWHVLARDADGHPIGTGRLLGDGHIGRIAVLKPWRGRGLGNAIMVKLIAMAKERGFAEVMLNAQVYALDFYRSLGFKAEGEAFMEAGIPHRAMRLTLATPDTRPVNGPR